MSVVNLTSDDRGVVRLELNRPDVRNAFDDELIAEITQAVASPPDGARVLVLLGAGRVFSAGADLNWMRSMAAYSREENVADSTKLRTMFETLDACPLPKVARVHGAAIAGATGLVACCDVAVATEGCVFAFTEVKLGLVPAVISPFVIRKVGYSFARAMFLTGERFDADRAYEAGLVHRVVPDRELDDVVEEIVAHFLAAGPESVRLTRALVDRVAGAEPREVREYTVKTIADVRVSPEGQEGVAAFFEKRPPSWAPPSG